MDVIFALSTIYFFSLFDFLNEAILEVKYYQSALHLVPRVRNSSYSLIPVNFKHRRLWSVDVHVILALSPI